MESTFDKLTNAKMQRLVNWGTAWAFFMVLVFTPAFYCAAVIEGESFSDSMNLVALTLQQDIGIPSFIAIALMAPIALVAKLIPVAMTWPVIILGFFYPIFMIILPAMFFGAAEMPYYRSMKSAINPNWYAKENEHVVVKAKYGTYPFRIFMFIMIVCLFIGFFVAIPKARTPIADNWVGQVYISDKKGRVTKIDSQLELKIFDPGHIVDRKPGVVYSTVHIKFSGKDTEKLKAFGINDNFIAGKDTGRDYYPHQLCAIDKAVSLQSKRGYVMPTSYLVKNYLMTLKDNVAVGNYSNDLGCPKQVLFGVTDFHNAQFAINESKNGYYIFAKLKRDSRWNWIDTMMIGDSFIKDPEGTLEYSSLGVPFGYR